MYHHAYIISAKWIIGCLALIVGDYNMPSQCFNLLFLIIVKVSSLTFVVVPIISFRIELMSLMGLQLISLTLFNRRIELVK